MENSLAEVAIIVPTYRRPAMLRRAIQSIRIQDYANWRIILVASDCDEATRLVIDELHADPRITCLTPTKQLNGAQARNLALAHSSSPLIAFLDDDDEWLPGKLRLQVEYMQSHPGCRIVSCNYFRLFNNRKIPSHFPASVTRDNLLYSNLLGSFSFCMIRRPTATRLIINERIEPAEDNEFWLRLMEGATEDAHVLQQYLVNYYDHAEPRLTNNRTRAYRASVRFATCVWHNYNRKQKLFRLAVLLSMKNHTIRRPWIKKVRLSIRCAFLHLKSRRDLNLYRFCSLSVFPLFPSLEVELKEVFFRTSNFFGLRAN